MDEIGSCENCNADVLVDAEVMYGDIVMCAACGCDLEIDSRNPLVLVLANDEEGFEYDEEDEP